ncbi:hypothetical protein [Halobacillus sp. KGW1]|uniref:hypothetical protein n=1 Tax=Halobacillus sp. KGW1 TaxID=1793726 RepID=UPI0007867084|nr:hypothetical protein [Halobacillus sp. KGW1]
MKDGWYKRAKEDDPLSLVEVLEKHKDHLEDHELVVQLQDGLCKIHMDPDTSKYRILVDHYDESVNSTVERFLFTNG